MIELGLSFDVYKFCLQQPTIAKVISSTGVLIGN